ncbi:MAG: hypothetical protein LBP75_09955 [Planctomycetota bacterium]|jgi:ribose 1,5-bisphosphokinase PhnN|nr:hypothetical protein [Planctomycetota bacterium]
MQGHTPKLFVIVGSPASGKDELVAAVNIIGTLHAEIVRKHTSRSWKPDDADEMICAQIMDAETNQMKDNPEYDLANCDIKYNNYGSTYGIDTAKIWEKLRNGIFQVVVISNKTALNKIKQKFGKLAVFIYVYSTVTKEEWIKREKQKNRKNHDNYILPRAKNFDMAWNLYENNFLLFDHVLIYAERQEDLFDQIFRLFKAYENRLII